MVRSEKLFQGFKSELRHIVGSLITYLKLGWPVLALIGVIAVAGFVLLLNVAREQDRSYELASQNLMQQSLQMLVKSNAQVSSEYGLWNDAFENITASNNVTWMDSNYYSSISSVIAVVRSGSDLRFLFVADEFKTSRSKLAALVMGLDLSSHRLYEQTKVEANIVVAPQGLVLVDGRLAAIAVEPIRPDKFAGGGQPSVSMPVDFVVSMKFINAEAITQLGQALSLEKPKVTIGATAPLPSKDRVALAIQGTSGTPVAWMEWQHERPGSQAFVRRIIPIGLALFLLGILVSYVTQVIVSRQMRLLELARLSAEDASKAKSSFLANISHELRTPLNAIIGYSEILEEDCIRAHNELGASDAHKVTRSAHHLLALINDLLDHSKIEAGKMDLNPTRVALAPIVEDVVEALRGRAAENRTILTITCDPSLGDAVLDGMRLKQCLLNLLSNAAKFTKDGVISIAARPVDQGGVAFVRFSVKDTGIGMNEATMAKLFVPFVQADQATAQKFGGTGLGLVITQRLIEAMGGSVHVESIEGQGACFTLLVPRGLAWSQVDPRGKANFPLAA